MLAFGMVSWISGGAATRCRAVGEPRLGVGAVCSSSCSIVAAGCVERVATGGSEISALFGN